MKDENKSIDLVGILLLLWSKRKRLIINCFIGGVLSIIIAFSIPKEYTSEVLMAPEFSSGMSGLSGGISSLASMAGIDLGIGSGEDALYPEMYPQIVSSAPFLCELMEMPVTAHYKKEVIETDLYHYLSKYQRSPWWEKITKAPGRLIQKMKSNPSDTIVPGNDIDIRHLTRRQQILMKALNKKMKVELDKLTSVISVKATMQDPEIAAQLTQAVSDNLQKYIADYRSAKARKDLTYTEQLYSEAQDRYFEAQRKYAQYSDQHQGVVKMQYQIEIDRLSNEQDLAFGVYNQLAQQLELAKAKVQEQTPVSVIMQPAIVPYKASAPKKMMIGILYVFLAFFGTCAWYIVKECVVNRKQAE